MSEPNSRPVNSRVFLVGNPNCGKTSLFNALTGERHPVGNWPGVTVARIEGRLRGAGGDTVAVDLPGTYSLSALTPDERIVVEQLPDLDTGTVLNVIDAGNLERNLSLTLQLVEIGLQPVLALNCFDRLRESGAFLDPAVLSAEIGCPVFPTVARTGEGAEELLGRLVRPLSPGIGAPETPSRARPEAMEAYGLSGAWLRGVREVSRAQGFAWETGGAARRWKALQTLIDPQENAPPSWLAPIQDQIRDTLRSGDGASEPRGGLACLLAADRFSRISRLLGRCFRPARETAGSDAFTDRLDGILTHRWWGLPILGGLLALVFWSTFRLGEHPSGWIRGFLAVLGGWCHAGLPEGLLRDLLVDGIIPGVGGVLVFLPTIAILFLWIALLEDSGYLTRAAFLMDGIMRRVGLHGRAFIPLLMGFGCNVPAVLATRIVEDPRQRRLTVLLLPLVGCSARLPVLVLLCGTFFPETAAWWLVGLFAVNIAVILAVGAVVRWLGQVEGESHFLLEMPPYRLPTWRNVRAMLAEKLGHFLEKAGTVILAGTILVWFLSAFPRDVALSRPYAAEIQALRVVPPTPAGENAIATLIAARDGEVFSQRYMARLGRMLHPLVRPLGFGWREAVSLVPGFLAKESIVSTLQVLYRPSGEDLGRAMQREGMTPLTALSFMVFTLLYVPCLSTLTIIHQELRSWRFTAVALLLPAVLAWVGGFVVILFGGLWGAISGVPPAVDLGVVVVLVLGSAVYLAREFLSRLSGTRCEECALRHRCAQRQSGRGGSCEERQAEPVYDPRVLPGTDLGVAGEIRGGAGHRSGPEDGMQDPHGHQRPPPVVPPGTHPL